MTGRRLRRAGRILATVLGWAVLVVAVDWGLGWMWGELTGAEPESSVVVEYGSEEGEVDPRVDSPALAGDDWRHEYFRVLNQVNTEYVPFLYPRHARTESRYINAADGIRRSYEPPDAEGLPEVWFFGGSVVWGEGQRDLHTVPSEFARVAEAAGVPVRVVNFGERSYTMWQDATQFEQRLAERPAPALAVFYGGANDIGVQAEHLSPDPTHGEYARISATLEGRALGPGPPVDRDDGGLWEAAGDTWETYRDTSLAGRAVDRLGSVFGVQPALAQSAEPVARGAATYRRGRSLARAVARDHDLDAAFFWQPVPEPQPADRELARAMTPESIDLTDVFAGVGSPVFLDEIHTNELGARLVAEAMWVELEPHLRAAA